MRPMRSVLFVPGHRGSWVEKGIASGADGLILDLEDAVPEALKDQARAEVAASIARVRETDARIALWVRVNPLDSGRIGADLAAVVIPGVDGLLLPKIYGPKDVIKLDALISHFEQENGVAGGSLEILVGLETAEAFAACEDLAVASPRVATLFAGVAQDADVSRSIGFQFTAGGIETLYLRSRVVLACRSVGLDFPLGGIWQDLKDLDGARFQCEQNRQLGFKGQVCIHPSHVAVANEVFSPSRSEIEFYKGMITAFEVAEAGGAAAVAYEGMHVDYAHIKTAREFLAYAESLDQ
jgi:citrate lyase subunit beta / citryl-CoA lyase